MVSSLWANVYEDVLKYLLSDPSYNQLTQLSLLFERILCLITLSFFYIILTINILPTLIRKIWNKLEPWCREIDVDKLMYNALAPAQSTRQ
jgi:hypothetical protein